MVSKSAAGSWDESFVPIVDADDPEPLRVIGIQYPDSLSFADIHFILLLGLKIVNHDQLLDVLFHKGVHGGFGGVWTPWVRPAGKVAGVGLTLSAVTATLKS